MPSTPSFDNERPHDWGKTSTDYAGFRPGYPDSFFSTLRAIGIDVDGRRVLDLGSGPGVLAIPFALQGGLVTALDIAENQIAAARDLARKQGAHIDFVVADAHSTGLPSDSYDMVSASMCFHYFDWDIITGEISRLLGPDGLLLIASLLYLPGESSVAAESERLVLRHNPDWSSAGFTGDIPPIPEWSVGRYRLKTFHRYIEDLPFTREGWRGRMRACRGVGASMSPETVQDFDSELASLVERSCPPQFGVPHLITIHVLEPA